VLKQEFAAASHELVSPEGMIPPFQLMVKSFMLFSFLDYAGFEKRTCDPCVPVIFVVTVLLPVPTFAGTAGKSLLLFTTEAVCPVGQW
jgi:hypothetical protein